MIPVYLVPVLGFLSFLTPCMWNLNLILRAYVNSRGISDLIVLALSRFALMNLIALVVYLASSKISLDQEKLAFVQVVIGLVFILGFPAMRKIGFAPLDLSPQFLFPGKNIRPGLALGLSIPYCSVPFIVLLVAYSLAFKTPFLIFNLYTLAVTLPTLVIVAAPEVWVRKVSHLIPVVPAVTGVFLILSLSLVLDFGGFTILVSSLLQDPKPLYLIVPLMFLMGFLTSLGPSTLPLLPVVFGILVTRHGKGREIAYSVVSFLVAFGITHSLLGALASLGAIAVNSLFRTEIFSLVVALLLILIALHLIGLVPMSLEVARLNPVRDPRSSSFLIGVAYTFSMCPSCTSLFAGALLLSATFEDPALGALLMLVYSVGRSTPVFLSGFVTSALQPVIRNRYRMVNLGVAFLFIVMSLYFMRNFLNGFLRS